LITFECHEPLQKGNLPLLSPRTTYTN
jgi:hypothetical protein